MNRYFLLPLLAAFGLSLGACQKQPTEADRNAEVERQVQERLAAERQADEQQKLADRQAELDARERALAEKENRPAPTAAPVATAKPSAPAAAPTRDSVGASYATFYRKLDPYGDWMETSDYGYVFQPRQAAQSRDWRPYTNGHWVYTDAGWTWISDEQFGWATYHYGRWTRLRSVGWVWVPGEQWAPAWVSWRKGNDYVGWAPLPPEAQFNRQTGIRNWADSYYDIGPEQYAFVPANQFGAKQSARVVVPTERNVTIINNTVNITNITYNNSVIVDRGPSYDDFRGPSSQPIERFRLERTPESTNDRPVFRGEVVALPTIDFRPAERAARPNRVTRTITQPVVERGWAGIQDQQAARKARAKIEAEATPPPNLPPKKFVRPEPASTVPPRPAVVDSTPVPTPVVTAAPVATATPAMTPPPAATVRPPRPGAKPRPTATVAPTAEPSATPNETPAATVRPPRPGAKPRPTMTVPPAAGPAATPNETPAAEAADPTPPVPAENIYSPKEADRNRRLQGREEKSQERRETQAQRRTEREQQMQERREKKFGRPTASPASEAPAATPESPATASPAKAAEAPAAAESPAAPESAREKAARKREEKRDRKKERKAQKGESSPEPEASPEAPQP